MNEGGNGTTSRALEVLRAFLRLGCTAFGGPVAHLAYFRRELVERRAWVDARTYADLLALCQFLPGPASSQLGMALGFYRAGPWGLVLAWVGFTLPAALILTCASLGLAHVPGAAHAPWLAGLRVTAVAVVAQAVLRMARDFCTRITTVLIAVFASVACILWPGTITQLGVIGFGALAGRALLASTEDVEEGRRAGPTVLYSPRVSISALILFGAFLIIQPFLLAPGTNSLLGLLGSMYRAGALVFGGGHVVLPLLQPAVVPAYLSNENFLAGYGLAQAVPGPLFAFSAYIGAAAPLAHPPLLTALLCLVAIYLPSFFLVVGTLPYWERLRHGPHARTALAGVNAAVVGILAAAFYQPVLTSGVTSAGEAGVAAIGFLLLSVANISSAWVLLICTALTAVLHLTH
jgi:chromate transporter